MSADLISVLKEGFEYDRWANGAWLDAIDRMPDPDRPLEVMAHVAWAQEIWAERIDGVKPVSSDGEVGDRLAAAHLHWIQLLNIVSLDHVVSYKNTSGTTYQRQFGAIARHVIDHGTYHRGHLRGLAEMQGFDEFPETGMNGFFVVMDLHG